MISQGIFHIDKKWKCEFPNCSKDAQRLIDTLIPCHCGCGLRNQIRKFSCDEHLRDFNKVLMPEAFKDENNSI